MSCSLLIRLSKNIRALAVARHAGQSFNSLAMVSRNVLPPPNRRMVKAEPARELSKAAAGGDDFFHRYRISGHSP